MGLIIIISQAKKRGNYISVFLNRYKTKLIVNCTYGCDSTLHIEINKEVAEFPEDNDHIIFLHT